MACKFLAGLVPCLLVPPAASSHPEDVNSPDSSGCQNRVAGSGILMSVRAGMVPDVLGDISG
jgi:hypothetical protein